MFRHPVGSLCWWVSGLVPGAGQAIGHKTSVGVFIYREAKDGESDSHKAEYERIQAGRGLHHTFENSGILILPLQPT